MGENAQEKDCRWEPLGQGHHVLVTEEHGFTTDTLLLSHFSLPRPGEICADFGTGCGTIPLLWCMRGKPHSVLAVELQENAVQLALKSAEENGFSEVLQVMQGDIRDYRSLLPHQGFHLIACNPPYYPLNSGALGGGARKMARHEESLTLTDLAAAARYSLRYGGRLCVCLPGERLAEAMEVFRRQELEPKRLRLVQSAPGKQPYLFLLECRRGGKPGVNIEPVLLLTDGGGDFTNEMKKIYGEYEQNPEREERR
ncbi:MAG: methyltransferase [Acutalibacter sp.]|nr:methyltransferase [Acutalibacter sp.]